MLEHPDSRVQTGKPLTSEDSTAGRYNSEILHASHSRDADNVLRLHIP